MVPYSLREARELRKDMLEVAAASVALVVVLVCAVSNVPRLYLTTPAARAAKEREVNRQSFAQLQAATRELQARDEAVQAELAKITRLLETTRSNLANLTEGQGALNARVAATAAKLQQFETTVHQTNERLTKFSESAVLEQLTKERDDAVTRADQSDDQVRQLTLKLQKAGIYP
jgi:septal ring factor EnvC (AmiA/AmiB activator)